MEGMSVVVEYVIVLKIKKKNIEWVKKWEKIVLGKKLGQSKKKEWRR